jgi:hypothetical protein
VCEHLLLVSKVSGINDREFDAVFPEKVGQDLLALNLGELAEGRKVAISPQKIEGVIDETILFTRSEHSTLGTLGHYATLQETSIKSLTTICSVGANRGRALSLSQK